MYTRKENQIWLDNSESGPKDIPENQDNTFHVEHNKHNIKSLELYNQKIYNMKKFKAITKNRVEFLFAPILEQAENMWNEMYPFSPALITETDKSIYE